MRHMSRKRSARTTRACVLAAAAVTLLFLSIVPAALGAPLRIIDDPVATPSFEFTVAGSADFPDAAMAVTADSSGAYIAGERGNAVPNADASLVKVVGGVQKWVKWYDGPAHKADWVYKVVKFGNAVYTAGYRTNAANEWDILLVRWSAVTGAVKWARVYDGPLHNNDAATALGVDRNGNVTVAGFSQGAGGEDWVVVSWSPAGERRWVWRYAGSAGLADRPMDLVIDGSNRVYVTGWINVTGPKVKAMTVKFSPAGAKSWSRTTFGPGGLEAGANGIAIRPAGGIYIVGRTRALATAWDGFVMRYSNAGSGTSLPNVAGPGDQDFWDVAVTSQRAVVAVGYHNPGGDTDPFYVVFGRDDSLLTGSSSGGAFNDAYTAVAADSFGGFYPVGYFGTDATHSQWNVRRYALPGSGNAVWRSLIYGTNGLDVPGPAALLGAFGNAVAAYGNKVYVVGSRFTGGPTGVDQQIAVFMY